MSVRDLIKDASVELAGWRRDLHAHPEMAFEEHRTSGLIAARLASFGIEVHQGLAGTGVVGTLRAGSGRKAIGLRADMDALRIHEQTGLPYGSATPGVMHACGHDGHTVMLLGAAQYLARTRNFDGTVHFIFQPAEEEVGGARVMISEGLFEKFPMSAVYGMHNWPGLPAGQFAWCDGPAMASADLFSITVSGAGGHWSSPHRCVDVLPVAAQIALALQTIVSRKLPPIQPAVLTVTRLHAGKAVNAIEGAARLDGIVGTFSPEVRDLVERNLREMAASIAAAHGASADITYDRRYCPTINSPAETARARHAAAKVVGEGNVVRLEPQMAADDFGFMLEKVPGCYLFIGNSGPGPVVPIHNEHYDFNDALLPLGSSYWAELVEAELKRGGPLQYPKGDS